MPLEESRRTIEPAYQVVTAKLQHFHVRHLLRRVSSIVTFRPRDPRRHRYRLRRPHFLLLLPPWAQVGLATVSPAATQNRSTRILFITEGKTYCISMIRLDEKDRGIIEDFWSKGDDERMHMTPKNLSDGQCWKIVRLSRSPVPREFALDYRTDSVPEHQFMRWKRGGVCTCATTAASLRCTSCSRSH